MENVKKDAEMALVAARDLLDLIEGKDSDQVLEDGQLDEVIDMAESLAQWLLERHSKKIAWCCPNAQIDWAEVRKILERGGDSGG